MLGKRTFVFSVNQLINITNVILFIAAIVLISIRVTKTQSKPKNTHPSNIPPPPNLNEMSYDELIEYHKTNYLKKYEKVTYLDYANNPILPGSIIENFTKNIHENLYGNPHSESPSAELSTNVIEEVREKMLKFFNTNVSEYTLVFTYSHFHALKLLTESSSMDESTYFFYPPSSSNNILGLRSIAQKKKSNLKMVELNEILNPDHKFMTMPENKTKFNLLVVPLVDEFDGTVLSKQQIKEISAPKLTIPKNSNESSNEKKDAQSDKFGEDSSIDKVTAIVVDASLYLQNNRLNLAETPFHAVAMSFEKMFGFPNIGCLLLHNSLIPHLKKPYFGGGTLVYALTGASFEKLRLSPQDRFEDGSLPFLSIASIESGFDLIDSLQFNRIVDHLHTIKEYLHNKLHELRHMNGSPAVIIYGKDQVSITTFNVLDKDSNIVNWNKVVNAAAQNDIYIVGGCFSTPGSCMRSLKIDESKIKEEVKSNSDIESFGAVRASFGWATTKKDIDNLITFLKNEFVH
ncbi:molybdenum cofactor sulfurase [Tritrichomonas foetus]|uniref:Molybdenum cofactor sulfurase n=1 Tax=Tritrichomonas foetus TaxID=1144522 RepID=A0A1J4J436_9EUKA|nr:molybdenum cofactor sulfurase [Tritrichomonas foetus]|eukprot:OHS94192.1 molybdenum cofactor sulfurase [Tritrichomonas foetus]